MANNRENLKTLLNLIEDLLATEGNEWFHDELGLLFAKKIIVHSDMGLELCAVAVKEHGSIDKYIENGIIPIVKFDEVKSDLVRLTLVRDNVEMWKFCISRYRSEPDFFNFCAFALFQVEQLANYYIYSFCNKNDSEIKMYLGHYLDKYDESKFVSIGQVDFAKKLEAINAECNLEPALYSILRNISKVRNNALHRSKVDEMSFSEIEKKFKEAKSVPKEAQDKKHSSAIHKYYVALFINQRDYIGVNSAIVDFSREVSRRLNFKTI